MRNPENTQKIHDASMAYLEKAGIKIHHEEALRLLKNAGIKISGQTAYFTEEQIMFWIRKAPTVFPFYAKNPKYNCEIGGENRVYAPGYGAPMIMDDCGTKRSAKAADFIRMAKLFETNPRFPVNGGVLVQPSDIPSQLSPLLMYYMSLLYSEKCLETPAGNSDQVEAMALMAETALGTLDKPKMLTIVNTNSPLQLDKNMMDTLLTYGKYHQPVVVAAAAMAGSTAPITLAATIALTNAEVLATIALAQIAHPGTPVIYGSQSTTSDLQSGNIAIGAPEGALCYSYCAEMAKFYQLPSRGGGALTDAKSVDAQSGYESMFTLYTCHQAGIHYIIHSAGILDGYSAMSYEKVITDFELLAMLDRYEEDINTDEENLAADLVIDIGPGGEFMTSEHTLRHCRTAAFRPEIGLRKGTAKDFQENIQRQLKACEDAYKPPAHDDSMIGALEEILYRNGVTKEILAIIPRP